MQPLLYSIHKTILKIGCSQKKKLALPSKKKKSRGRRQRPIKTDKHKFWLMQKKIK